MISLRAESPSFLQSPDTHEALLILTVDNTLWTDNAGGGHHSEELPKDSPQLK